MKKQMTTVLLPAAALCAAAYYALPAAAEEADAVKTGWQEENGKKYYYDAEGNKAVGEVKIDDITYVFAPNGALQVGWQSVGDKRFYYNQNGEAEFGWIDWRGGTYYVSRTNGKLTGSAKTDDGKTYQFDQYGVAAAWQESEEGWRYADSTGEILIDGIPYLFSEDGFLLTGWQTAADGITRYYDAKTHETVTGWFTDSEGRRFCCDPETGKKTGFVTGENGNRCYIDSEKGMLTGWQIIDGKQYKLLADGTVFTGFYPVNGITYLFGEDGVMVSGWFTNADGKYYFTDKGIMQTGLTEIDGSTYYFNENGIMQTGVQDVTNPDGTVTRCEFGEDGKMVKKVTGWQTVDGVKHYINPDGSMATAPTVIDGKIYLFDAQGKLVSGLYIAPNGSKYYGDANGVALSGWIELPDQSSYFTANGTMAVSTTVDGYTIDANGAARNSRAITVDNYLKNTTGTIYSVYQNFCANHTYSAVENARTTDQLMAAGWDNLIDPTLLKRRGVCYHLAASLDFMFKRAGIQSRVVYAWHNSHHYWCQIQIDGVWMNFDPTYGMERCNITMDQQNAADRAKGGPGYTVRGYVDAIYDKKGALVSAKYTPV